MNRSSILVFFRASPSYPAQIRFHKTACHCVCPRGCGSSLPGGCGPSRSSMRLPEIGLGSLDLNCKKSQSIVYCEDELGARNYFLFQKKILTKENYFVKYNKFSSLWSLFHYCNSLIFQSFLYQEDMFNQEKKI